MHVQKGDTVPVVDRAVAAAVVPVTSSTATKLLQALLPLLLLALAVLYKLYWGSGTSSAEQ